MTQVSQTPEINTPRAASGRFALLLLALLLGVVGWNFWPAFKQPPAVKFPAAVTDDAARAVVLKMEQGGDRAAPLLLLHHPGMTVLDAMASAARIDSRWRFEHVGQGEGAFLTALGGVANEGAGQGGSRNWQYEVNNQRATVSFGAYELAAGDRVLWKFAPYE